jgi:hypothetical protein
MRRPNMKPIVRRSSFLLAFSLALGVFLTATVVALAGPSSFTSARTDAPSHAADVFTAFDRARTDADALSQEAATMLAAISPSAPSSALDPGKIVPAESRRVIGPNNRVIYLVPTEKQQVCYGVPDSHAVGCTDGSRLASDGVEFSLTDPDGLGQGEPTAVSGFVAADVVSVEVSTPDSRRSMAATLNGVFGASSTSVPDGLVVTFQDGSTRNIPIPSPPER